MVRLFFQDFFQHFHRAFWIFLHFSLRSHNCERCGRHVEQTLFRRFAFRHLSAAQQLATGEKLRLLPQDSLHERDRVSEIAQLDRRHRLQPMTALRFAQFLLSLNGHDKCLCRGL